MMEFLDEELFASYTEALVKSKDLILGRMATYDLSRDIAIMDFAARSQASQVND